MSSRRSFLRTLASTCSLGAAGLWRPHDARASGLGLAERLERLHSNQLSFDAGHKPRISIALHQGATEAWLSAREGLELLPSGLDGPRVRGGRRWRIRLGRARAGEERFAVRLGDFAPDDRLALEQAQSMWRRRGIDSQTHEIGAVFGVRGRVLDTRRVVVATSSFADKRQAQRVAERLQLAYGVRHELHVHRLRRADGTILADDLDHETTVEAPGVMWFASGAGQPIEVRGAGEAAASAYRGQVYVAIDRNGKLAVVNVVDEIGVLSGIVPAEMFASAPAAALEAQAIAARGQLLARIGTRHRDDPFLLCADQHCQVYAGLAREDRRSNRAVEETAGRVLMRPTGTRLANTVYSANCGGHTENNDDVWASPPDPLLRGRADPLVDVRFAGGIDEANLEAFLLAPPRAHCHLSAGLSADSFRWEVVVDAATVEQNPGIPPGFGRLRELRVRARGRSGRAKEVELVGDGADVVIRRELAIRRALGGLRSSLFLVRREAAGQLRLVGGGHGHGVGMCQQGAIGMASAGLGVAAILQHYYRGAELARLW
ncbi:MAG: SpoIID/LytB domain-containing protein [Myxococcales bacterium FL481]|nr:MAG: SpoIID/LytB domain-containing protein [Myxococcales bacterium FL481]